MTLTEAQNLIMGKKSVLRTKVSKSLDYPTDVHLNASPLTMTLQFQSTYVKAPLKYGMSSVRKYPSPTKRSRILYGITTTTLKRLLIT